MEEKLKNHLYINYNNIVDNAAWRSHLGLDKSNKIRTLTK